MRWCQRAVTREFVERESSGLAIREITRLICVPPPLWSYPHFPFVFIDQVLGGESPAFIARWALRPELRSQIVERWCALAKSRRWAWDECEVLRKHLVRIRGTHPASTAGREVRSRGTGTFEDGT